MKKGAILDMKGARLGNKKVRNWVMKKTHKKGARLGKKGAKMDKTQTTFNVRQSSMEDEL